MKRSYQHFCRENEPAGTLRLQQLPVELMAQIMQHLDLASMQALVRVLARERAISVDPELHRVDIGEYDAQTLLFLDQLQLWLRSLCPSEYQYALLKQITAIQFDGLFLGDRDANQVPLAEQLRLIARAAQNVHYAALFFLTACVCERCSRRFSRTQYFEGAPYVLPLCETCYRLMEQTVRARQPIEPGDYKDGYAWIDAKQLKALCSLPNATRASTYAAAHQIRMHKRSRLDWPAQREPERERYLLLDARTATLQPR